MRFEKGEKKFSKRRIWTRVDRAEKHVPYIYTTETDVEWVSFCSVDYPNHTLMGRVSVSSLCQQGGLLALSVNVTLSVKSRIKSQNIIMR